MVSTGTGRQAGSVSSGHRSGASAIFASPIDFAHLRRYTSGNADLEREVLGLFCGQAVVAVEGLRTASSEKAWREAAHMLKGSALVVGAWEVARVAERAEAGSMHQDLAVVARLEAALADVRSYLAALGVV
ncbi:MAG: Hpt domain-containing protein [Hyphomicrobiaceae bacterium]|nr:Hpt domain-containing protein [Hyphomicrobiaceae bacterium]